jgi:ribonuclease BN (tRNA processing enzyme)
VELDNVSIAFSGDTDGNNGNLERLAHNANLLVAHNAVPEGASGVERSLHMRERIPRGDSRVLLGRGDVCR